MTAHLPILPILLPMIGGAASLFVEHRRFGTRVQRIVAWVFMLATLAAAIALFRTAAGGDVQFYLLGDWPARLGIVLMADRLSALMVLTTALLGAACLLHACSGWDRRAPHFHALFQLQLAGLAGAFLTGDIFNLFVFFEVMLIASYGLMLSGGRGVRMSAGLHYVAFNIAASTLFLISLGLIYGLLGSLNMAELSARIAAAAPESRPLVQAALGLLLVVFCAKAALLPMYLWLPEAYTRAPAAVAALFAIMTKVGVYASLRVGSLWFGPEAGAFAGFGQTWIVPAAVAGLGLAALGVLAAARMRVLVAYLVIASASTLFIAFGLGTPAATAAGLYYMVHSSFVAAALFMVADLVRRGRGDASSDIRELVAPPAMRRTAGVMYLLAAISVAGLPPLSGFIGKAAILAATPTGDVRWAWPAILASSFMVVVGLTRAGSRIFWRTGTPGATQAAAAHTRPRLRLTESAAVALLLALGVAMSLLAAPLLGYTQAAAEQLRASPAYLEAVRDTLPARRRP
ncbi:monovalent cation/H+ antiporter subunit D [Arenimonas fontis]|uniref:Monovalent cation/H+ antiporter subunit D n=1 Tax=Arenimonas fontis TaxID=2608255 RepID=A0A5B2ZAR1_9GAMM|nr:monovalent cation/H+ antiporter subunit D [Arenimonas fontis]KAA2285035.1 monovalent cation/H+ antiporter subunit D [Arenimonas fontis]